MPEPLTARRLETIKPPATGRTEVLDQEQRGLCFRVTANGERSFSLRIKVEGRSRRFPIGPYPEVSLSEARKRASRLRLEALDGRDPIEARKQEKARKLAQASLSEVLQVYSDAHLSKLARGPEVERALRSTLARHLPRPAEAVTKANLQIELDTKTRTAPVQANRLRAYLRHFFGWAEGRGYVQENPAKGIARPAKERPRDRVLSLSEVAAIWKASAELGPVWRQLVRMMIMTAQRRGELARVEWHELEGGVYAIPAARTKTDAAHIVHLSAPVLEELEALRQESGGAGLVFTHTGRTPVSGFSKIKRRLDALSGVTDWRFHDFRTAFASNMAEAGESEGIVDRVLNHAASASRVSTVARVYQRSALLPQRAQCLDRWAAMVLRAAGEGGSAEVVRIGAGA
jgi:integrase